MTTTAASVGRLVVCPTPIGNLQDVTLRVLDTLRSADVIACEDTRRTGLLLARLPACAPEGSAPVRVSPQGEGHGLAAAAPARLVSLHEHNERARTAELLERIGAGALVALVSDAGAPLVSDPGFALVQACLRAGLAVEVLPGPSAVTTALVASGLPAERWRFVGFLPRARRELRELLGGAEETLVAFESPRRLARTLELLAEHDPERAAAVCRELTKLHEEVRRGPASDLAAHYREQPARGEVTLVIGAAAAAAGAGKAQVGRADAVAAVRELVQVGAKPRAAAGVVGRLTGTAANELYRELVRARR